MTHLYCNALHKNNQLQQGVVYSYGMDIMHRINLYGIEFLDVK